jgi:hypothetical protein
MPKQFPQQVASPLEEQGAHDYHPFHIPPSYKVSNATILGPINWTQRFTAWFSHLIFWSDEKV